MPKFTIHFSIYGRHGMDLLGELFVENCSLEMVDEQKSICAPKSKLDVPLYLEGIPKQVRIKALGTNIEGWTAPAKDYVYTPEDKTFPLYYPKLAVLYWREGARITDPLYIKDMETLDE